MAIDPAPDDNFPLFSGESWEDHVSSWFETGQMINDGLWLRGAIAASLQARYGDEAIDKFAGEVMVTGRTVRRYRQVYKFYENGQRCPFCGDRQAS